MKKKIFSIMTILLVFSLVLVGCGKGNPDTKESVNAGTTKIVIASKDFTESIIVSELYTQALKAVGYNVEHKQALGGTPIIHQAMLSGELDIIGEYTSTGIAMVLKEDSEFDPQIAYEKVKAGYAEQFNFTWLDMSQVNNSQGLAVSKEMSDKYQFTKISQLPNVAANLRFFTTPEFEERDDGLKGLREKLGTIEFQNITVGDKSLKYEVLRKGETDMVVCFTTDAALAKGNIVLLEDDISFWPPYHLTPVVRQEVLDKEPNIAEILNKVSAHLTTEVMQELNAKVDVDGQEYAAVAAQALKDWGINA